MVDVFGLIVIWSKVAVLLLTVREALSDKFSNVAVTFHVPATAEV